LLSLGATRALEQSDLGSLDAPDRSQV